MIKREIKIERKQLHKQVWSKPMSKLAKDYGISDVGLKKICKKLNVPTPPRGYWARIYGGQNAAVRFSLIFTVPINLKAHNFGGYCPGHLTEWHAS